MGTGVLTFILSVFLVFGSSISIQAEEKKLKFRGSADINADLSEVVINIHPEMLALDKFGKLDEKYKSLKAYSKELDKSAKPRKKIKFRGAAKNIYTQYADSVVYIGNYEAKVVGTGSLIHKNGLIISNWHVVDQAEMVGIWIKPKEGQTMDEVTMLNDIEPYMGTILETDKKRDLAIIKVAGLSDNMKVIELGNLSDVGVTDNVYAIGHPEGLPWSFTLGIVSQIRPNHKWSYDDDKTKHEATLIQTQTPISPGNSGGPLFSGDGKLVGVNTSKAGGENLNFAVSVEHVKELLKANPGLDKINPGSAQMKKDYPNAKTWDENKNGVVDTWYVDTNNNGKIDTAFLDDDEDGLIEGVLIDKNENEVWEILVIDTDLDGNPDQAFMDDNEDGKPDVIAYDYNQDGEWDKFEEIG